MDKKAAEKNSQSGRIIYILIILIGAAAFLYPLITNAINTQSQSQVISNYEEEIRHLDKTEKEELLREAESYNSFVAGLEGNVTDEITESDKELSGQEYVSVLGAGRILGSIEIPKIGVNLPVYQGSDEAILDLGVGHLERTSLPIGGQNTHAVLTGHRGLPTSRMFRDLGALEKGDVFLLRTLDETLAYEIESSSIVLPHEFETLRVQEGRDLCTLVTCEPYMVNSHRMLVTAHRSEYIPNIHDEPENRISFFQKYLDYIAIIAAFVALGVIVAMIRKMLRKNTSKANGCNEA